MITSLAVFLLAAIVCGSSSTTTEQPPSSLPYYLRHALRKANQHCLLAVADDYVSGTGSLDSVTMLSMYAARNCQSAAQKALVEAVPVILNEYTTLSCADFGLRDDEFLDLYGEKFGTGPLTAEGVIVTDLMHQLNINIQMLRLTSNATLASPNGLSKNNLESNLRATSICERKLDAHRRACTLLYPKVDFWPNKVLQEKLKEYDAAKSLLKKHLELFCSTDLIQFSMHFAKIGTQTGILISGSTDMTLVQQRTTAIDVTKVQYGLPICLEIGMQVALSMSMDLIQLLNAKITEYQRRIVELFVKSDSMIFDLKLLMLEKVNSELNTKVQSDDLVCKAVNEWLISWTSLASRGLFPTYQPSPNPRPFHFSPAKHLQVYSKLADEFLRDTLRPYLFSCFKNKRLIPQTVMTLKEAFDANVAIGRVITTMPVYMMQGGECVKTVNAPMATLVKSYLSTIAELSRL